MNLKNLLVVLSVVTIAIISCKSTPKNPEVENYVNVTMPAFMKEELAIMKEYNDFTEVSLLSNPKTDTAIRTITIPKYTKFIQKLDTITIKDPELKVVHQQYITVSKSQLEYFSMMLNSLKDPINSRDTLNKKLSTQNSLMIEWNSGLRRLCSKYDISYLGN
jgi:hypothetical protein